MMLFVGVAGLGLVLVLGVTVAAIVLTAERVDDDDGWGD